MSHHPTSRESHLAHEDARNEASRRLRDATRLIEAHEHISRLREALQGLVTDIDDFGEPHHHHNALERARAALFPPVR